MIPTDPEEYLQSWADFWGAESLSLSLTDMEKLQEGLKCGKTFIILPVISHFTNSLSPTITIDNLPIYQDYDSEGGRQ